MKRLRIIDALLVAPLIANLLYFGWATFLAAPESCSAESYGLCFSLGIPMGAIVLPLTVICTPVMIFRLLLPAKQPKLHIC